MPDENPALNAVMKFSEMVVEAANRVAAESDLTMEQAITVVNSAVLMLVNGTLYGGLAKN